ncbi:hypothetical protein MMC11_001870 [Xylographa trunciseda]|nr:hypothetical protein [Xylographa trunciseda]
MVRTALSDFITKAVNIKAKDVGIILRQSIPCINTVSLDDLYGTLDPSDCKATLQLPGANWKFPLDDLPALTLTLGSIAAKSGHTATFALIKEISDLGFAALEASFSFSKMRPQFDATIFCNNGVSLGQIVSRGLDILSPNFLDDDMFTTLHLGALSPKSVADATKDALDEIMVPAARVQVAKLASGSYGVSELELKLQLKPIGFPENKPVFQLRDMELRLFQERNGKPLPGDSGNSQTNSTTSGVSPPPSSVSITSVYGSATVLLGSMDASCKFTYDPSSDAQLASLGLNPSPPSTGRQLVLDIVFVERKPAIGDLVNQILGEVAMLAHEGSFASMLPTPLLSILDVVSLETIQFTLASEKQESSPWELSSVYVLVDISQLLDDINIFGDALVFENPSLAIRVDNPTTTDRAFDIKVSSIIVVSGVVCTIVADISNETSPGAQKTGDTIAFTFQWDPVSSALCLGHVLAHFADELVDDAIETSSEKSYIDAIREIVPEGLVQLVDDINLTTLQVVAADFLSDPSKHEYGLAMIYVQVEDDGAPWAPFGDSWAHLTFSNSALGYTFYSGNALADPSTPSTVPKGSTNLTFGTKMQMAKLTLNVQFSYSNSATEKTFQLTLREGGSQNFTLVDLISDMVDDIAGISTIQFPDDAKKLFDINLDSLSITYTKVITPSTPTEQLSFSQSGGATFLGIQAASISVLCDKSSGSWGYALQVQLQPVVKPFAKILPIPGVEDLTVVNGTFSIFKGPVLPPPKLAPMVSKGGGDGVTIYLNGGLKLGGNDFMDLVGTILKIPEVDFALQNNGTLTIAIPVGKIELIIAGHPMFSIELFQLQISQGNIFLSAEMDFLCEWLAPSIKDHPIGFKFALGIGVDGSLDISIYAVDPKTSQLYPNMSKDPFIVRPFYIPGLVLYPFHFSMRWLAEAEEPEAIAAGGGFGIQGTDISNLFAFSVDEKNPTQNYVDIEIEDLTVGSMFGVLVPDDAEFKELFSHIDIGFKALNININPGQKRFHVDADFIFYVLKGKLIADVDPTSGLRGAATVAPLDFGNGLIKLLSYSSGNNVGPFVHLNTNIKDLVTGKVPQNPVTPDWAGLTSDDPKLDNSTFALTAKFHFLCLELDIFGLLDKEGLMLMTSMGLDAKLPGLSISAKRQMSVSVNSTVFSASASFNFDLVIDVPPAHVAGVDLGGIPSQKINLDLSMLLQIRYDRTGWMNDGLVYEASFIIDILGLHLDIPHMEIEITVKDLKDIPEVIGNFIRDKVIDFLEENIAGGVEDAVKDVKKVATEVVDTMTQDFNVGEQDVAHAFTECGQGVENTALTLKHDLGMGLDEAVGVFMGLGHDISHFGEGLANAFGVSKAAVAGVAVLKGACSVEHAMAAGLGQPINDLKNFRNGLVGVATDLGNIGHQALNDLETKEKEAGEEVKDKAKDVGNKVEDTGKDAGKKIEDTGKDTGKKIEDTGKDAGKKIEDTGKDTGKKIENTGKDTGKKIEDTGKTIGKGLDKGVSTVKHGAEHAGSVVKHFLHI